MKKTLFWIVTLIAMVFFYLDVDFELSQRQMLNAATGFTIYQIANAIYVPADLAINGEITGVAGGPLVVNSLILGSTLDANFTIAASQTVTNQTIGFITQHVSFENTGPNNCFVATAAGATTSSVPVAANQTFDTDIATGTISAICNTGQTATFQVYARGTP